MFTDVCRDNQEFRAWIDGKLPICAYKNKNSGQRKDYNQLAVQSFVLSLIII